MVPQKIQIRTMDSGELGALGFIESRYNLPFSIRRIYYIYGGKENSERGHHAHKKLWQCMIVIKGSLTLVLDGDEGSFSYPLNNPREGIIIPPGYWREMHNITSDAVILVLASHDYDESDYIRDHNAFKSWLKEQALKPVPYLELSRYIDTYGSIVENSAIDAIRSGTYINGQNVQEFEQKFAAICGTRYAVGVGNGFAAIMLILEALGIGQGDEVIVCAAGFVATPLAVSRCKATPVFVDCNYNGNINPNAIERAIGQNSKAILLTHLYGNPADMDEINTIAEKYSIAVIEDACQAHGAKYKGRPCGSLGRAAAFSFYPTKNLGCFGDGGCVTTNDSKIASTVRKLANYGATKKYQHEIIGINSRLDEIQAAVLRAKLPYMHIWNERRNVLSNLYMERLSGIDCITLPTIEKNNIQSWHVFPIRVLEGKRDILREYLDQHGISTNIHYPCALHKQHCYSQEHGHEYFPEAETWAKEELSLPLDATHTDSEIMRICNAVRSFFGRRPI